MASIDAVGFNPIKPSALRQEAQMNGETQNGRPAVTVTYL
jgi:hypothetical protein